MCINKAKSCPYFCMSCPCSHHLMKSYKFFNDDHLHELEENFAAPAACWSLLQSSLLVLNTYHVSVSLNNPLCSNSNCVKCTVMFLLHRVLSYSYSVIKSVKILWKYYTVASVVARQQTSRLNNCIYSSGQFVILDNYYCGNWNQFLLL